MRAVLAIAVLAALGLGGWLYMEADQPVERTVPASAVSIIPNAGRLRAEAASERAAEAAPEPLLSGSAAAAKQGVESAEIKAAAVPVPVPKPLVLEDAAREGMESAACLRFGPVGEERLPELKRGLERSGLLSRMLLSEVDAAVYSVYCGPFNNEAAARKELNRLALLGLEGGRLEERKSGWSVKMGETRVRLKARMWAEAAVRAWSVKHIAVEEEREYRKAFNLIFPGLSPQENQTIRQALILKGADFSICD